MSSTFQSITNFKLNLICSTKIFKPILLHLTSWSIKVAQPTLKFANTNLHSCKIDPKTASFNCIVHFGYGSGHKLRQAIRWEVWKLF